MTSSPTWVLIRGVPGLTEGKSRFHEAAALWLGRHEVAHVHKDGSVDLRLTRVGIRERRVELRANPNVRLRPSSGSDWVEVKLQTPDAEGFVLELVELAVDYNRSGQELANRRLR